MQIDDFLDRRAKAETLSALPDEEYRWAVDHVGQFTNEQLARVLKTGLADSLRDVARDELVARAAMEQHWTTTPTFWLVLVSIVISVLAWLFPRSQDDSSGSPTPASKQSGALQGAPAPAPSPQQPTGGP